jgi:hypothetical protein
VLNPIKVFDGSFGGETIWENSSYVTPNAVFLNNPFPLTTHPIKFLL